ncbi:MAG TPA: hypothetical protein VFJ86_03505 [Usitatibacter sp.]|jgi:hypothetical protein|nr:hypothetical protein [Usitatibacter sp.]
METNEAASSNPGTALSVAQAEGVGGGDGSCTTTVQLSGPGFNIVSGYTSLSAALIGTYDGIVDASSHVIETVANTKF